MAKQTLKFAELYKNNGRAVEQAVKSLWCGQAQNESQRSYIRQISHLLKHVLTPENAIPLVECTNKYKPVYSVSPKEADDLVGGLWRKSSTPHTDWVPFEHQYQAWKTLLVDKTDEGKHMSMVIKTGTGSGKTEAFMIPLVYDLIKEDKKEQTQAIFLYPLNALMEDQKDRMQKLLEGTELTFAVYNGEMPESEPNENMSEDEKEKLANRIDDIRGITRDRNGNIIEYKYKNIIATRTELRQHPANILLTNPTMLEYILLRQKDKKLVNPDLQSLRWVCIDETHTYTGAGAAELAMLLRRVLQAFDVKAEDIRFATSSATLGNPEESKEKQEETLIKFIADITGLKEKQVRAIDGDRLTDEIPQGEDSVYWERLIKNADGYIELDKMFPEPDTIEKKLEHLDNMCAALPENTVNRVRVHFFYHVPNNGLFVKMDEDFSDGSFKIYPYNSNNIRKGEAPMLELSRCKHCGEYLAIAEVDEQNHTYQPITMDDSDMFDLEEDNEKNDLVVFGLSDKEAIPGDGNASFFVHGDKYEYAGNDFIDKAWHIVGNSHCNCPYCGTKLTKTPDDSKSTEVVDPEEDDKKLRKFRLPSDFIARLIAPSTLNELTPQKSEDELKPELHKGQQFISFVDSRQAAAKSTVKQNLEEERLWVYSTIFHKLCEKKATGGKTKAQEDLEAIINSTTATMPQKMDAFSKLQKIQAKGNPYLTWEEITEMLEQDPLCERFCYQFAKKSQNSEEINVDETVRPLTKRKYVQSMMVEYLSRRPRNAASPENMGLFTTCYPKLPSQFEDDDVRPQAVKDFNNFIKNKDLQIGQKDWIDLIQIFLDYTVRSNQSVYLDLGKEEYKTIDIFSTNRFETMKAARRPVLKPKVDRNCRVRIVRYLAALLVEDGSFADVNSAINANINLLQRIVDSMWDDLLGKYQLLKPANHWDEDLREIVSDKEIVIDGKTSIPYRLNLPDLAFKLYEDVYLCDTNTNDDLRAVEKLRPIETNFKGFSPYLKGRTQVVRLSDSLHEKWETYPYYKTSKPGLTDIDTLHEWAKTKRKLLWDNGLWNDDGLFADRLDSIHLFPDVFIQAEHTAQVDKMVSRQMQNDFKHHCLNILACSTTMEMGVDLGSLEVVMLTSVPPQPTNYKQRAGRAGRAEQIKSACITLCGSDAVGMRTMLHPKDNMIIRRMPSPYVDLNSAQVIQRHVNAFLIRYFGVFTMSSHGGSISQKVLDYYTHFMLDQQGNKFVIRNMDDNKTMDPSDGLGEKANTPYEEFNKQCSKAITKDLSEALTTLLRDTCLEGCNEEAVKHAREANERCYNELGLMVDDLRVAFHDATSQKQRNFYTIKYMEPLTKQLLAFWATHRFTPNANMPVDIIEFDVNSSWKDPYHTIKVSNPSYSLRQALSQYAPGNTVVVDGRSTIVRGVRYTDFFKSLVTFKKIYHNDKLTGIDNPTEIPDQLKWSVSGSTEVELVEPSVFLPDQNEMDTRVLEPNPYTRVNAQLIGADNWVTKYTEPHLYSFRNNGESGNAKILYYNEGLGYGYCHCTKCGRTVLETHAALTSKHPEVLPTEMNNIQAKDTTKPKYHYNISGRKKRERCIGCGKPEYIHRNVVLGGLIQTDYTEIRIRHINNPWLKDRGQDNNRLLITLGLLFSQSLADLLGKDRNAIDFTITPNGHICIFDTNPGGSGYSNQLAEIQMFKEVIKRSKEILEIAERTHSKEALVDKFTLFYVKDIDIQAARNWFNEEDKNARNVPKEIKEVFPPDLVSETSLLELERAFTKAQGTRILFVNNEYNHWDYGTGEEGWRGHLQSHFLAKGSETEFVVLKNSDTEYIPEPAKDMARGIESWVKKLNIADNPYKNNKLFPLAYINGNLYFTNNDENATLDSMWANGTMYTVKTNLNLNNLHKLNTVKADHSVNIFLRPEEIGTVYSQSLGKLIYEKAKEQVDEFVNYCKSIDKPVNITYQDEHLKSVLGMVLTMQTAEYFIKLLGKNFVLDFQVEKYEDLGARIGVMYNIRNSSKRNEILTTLSDQWKKHLANDEHIIGEIKPVVSNDQRKLTHWRVLELACGGKHLCIFPDAGFINGWKINGSIATKKYTITDTTTEDNVPLSLMQTIKIEVSLEDLGI